MKDKGRKMKRDSEWRFEGKKLAHVKSKLRGREENTSGAEAIFEKIMTENFPSLMKYIN